MRNLIVNSSLDAVIGVDEGGLITMWNAHAEVLFGWTEQEALGRSLVEAALPTDVQTLIGTSGGAILRKAVELAARRKNGERVDVELYVAQHSAGGRTIYILFARDISERKNAEREIRELNARLE